jgi:2-polyprenyl-3-methyl-5-hydroxy-6-metoxy-1,4-benzoquinol methylase
MPTEAELAAFYNNPAYYEQSDLGYADYLGEEAALRAQARRRLATINALHPGKGRLLDMGCAAGFFLAEARKDGWSVAGTELSGQMREYAEERLGLRVVAEVAELGGERFDVVTMWEVIEHLPAPLEALRELHSTLAPGGLVCLSTPNTAHLQAQRQPEDWWEFKPPAHLTYFTPETLSRLVEEAGYAVARLDRHTPALPVSGAAWARVMQGLRARVGDRLNRATPVWWVYSLLRNATIRGSGVAGMDLNAGLDLYARRTE